MTNAEIIPADHALIAARGLIEEKLALTKSDLVQLGEQLSQVQADWYDRALSSGLLTRLVLFVGEAGQGTAQSKTWTAPLPAGGEIVAEADPTALQLLVRVKGRAVCAPGAALFVPGEWLGVMLRAIEDYEAAQRRQVQVRSEQRRAQLVDLLGAEV